MSDSSSIPVRPGSSSRVFALIIAGAVLLSAGSAFLLTGTSGDQLLRWLKGQQKGGSAFDLWHGQPAPELLVVPWQGHPFQLTERRGRPVVLAFWASWSPLSRSLLVTLNEWAATRPEVTVLGIAAEEPDAARAFASPLGLAISLGSISASPPPPVDQIIAVPTTFFLDARGVIVHVEGGPLTAAQLERWLPPSPDA